MAQQSLAPIIILTLSCGVVVLAEQETDPESFVGADQLTVAATACRGVPAQYGWHEVELQITLPSLCIHVCGDYR